MSSRSFITFIVDVKFSSRLVYGLVVKRERKRHPRARGGRRVQEAKARKATKEAARLARLAEEESRAAEGATCTAEEAPSCTAAEEAVDVVEDAPATHAEGGEVEHHAEATSFIEETQLAAASVSEPAPEHSQPELPSRRRRRARRHTNNINVAEELPNDCPTIPSTIMEDGAGMARVVENALQEAAGSSGSAPPRAGSRRSRRRITTT